VAFRSTWTETVRAFVLLVVAAGLVGCGGPSVTMDQDPSAFEEEESQLEKRLSDNPDDAKALRDLGSIYLRTDRPSQAYDALKKAYSQRPEDPKVLFYLGLASEKVGRREAALDLFGKFGEVPEDSKYHTLMEGRYEWLNRKLAQQRAEQLVAEEQKRPGEAGADVSENTVAVVPLQYQGGDNKYEPLGRGLAEMLTTDLSNVERLKVVERVRLQALLDELKLAQSEYVEQATAPRVGRLLGAGRLVGGSYLVSDDEVRLQVTLSNVTTGERVPQLDQQRANLDKLFELQTRVTFSIVDQLDVELTPQERAAIEEVPTENIQAFLAYSRGLMEEDRGNYGAAARFYQQAQQIDPNFEQAQQRGRKAQSAQTGGGEPSEALASAEGEGQQGGQQQSEGVNVVEQRLQSMGAGPGAGLGESQRDPAQESSDADESSELDPPPPPPPQPSTGSGGQNGGQ
jgi:TolB-like protein